MKKLRETFWKVTRALSLTQRIMVLLTIGILVVGLAVGKVMEKQHHESTFAQTKQQALVFLFGVERELTANSGPKREILDRALRHRQEEFGFQITRLKLTDTKGNTVSQAVSTPKGSTPRHMWRWRHMLGTSNADHIGMLISGEHRFAGGDVTTTTNPETGERLVTSTLSIPVYVEDKIRFILSADLDLQATMALIEEADQAFETQITFTIAAASIGLLLLTWLVFRQSLLQPVRRITVVTSEIAKGKLDKRAEADCCPELGLLSSSINSMAADLQTLLTQQEEAYLKSITSLANALKMKDAYTAVHSARVARFSVMLGRRIELPEDKLVLLEKGALMHDLGKIGVPDLVLNKPGSLSDEEYALMSTHPSMTAKIMKPLGRFEDFAAIGAWHHERWDGKGYPDRLGEEDIPLLARVVSIADSWDAMTGDRVYRKGMSPQKALSIFTEERKSGQWDPELAGIFVEMMQDQPKTVRAEPEKLKEFA